LWPSVRGTLVAERPAAATLPGTEPAILAVVLVVELHDTRVDTGDPLYQPMPLGLLYGCAQFSPVIYPFFLVKIVSQTILLEKESLGLPGPSPTRVFLKKRALVRRSLSFSNASERPQCLGCSEAVPLVGRS